MNLLNMLTLGLAFLPTEGAVISEVPLDAGLVKLDFRDFLRSLTGVSEIGQVLDAGVRRITDGLLGNNTVFAKLGILASTLLNAR